MPEFVGTVKALYRVPVKSTAAESLEDTQVGWCGLVGDRGFAVRNDMTGQIVTGKTATGRPLLLVRSRLDTSGMVSLLFPDTGHWFGMADPKLNKVLSEYLGHPASLVNRSGDAEPAPTDFGFDLRQGMGADSSPIHLLTSASVQALESESGKTIVGAGYRPSLWLSAPDGVCGFVENAWLGAVLAIGGNVRLVVRKATERCPLPGSAQADSPAVPGLLGAVKRFNAGNLGVYAAVLEPGIVSVGDAVQIVGRIQAM